MTSTTSLTRTGRASSLQWMLPWPAESTSLPRGPHNAATTTSLTSSGVNSRVSSGTSSGTSSTDSSGVGGGKAAHPSGGRWLSGGWTWDKGLPKGEWKWVWGWQRGGWRWRRGSGESGTDGGIKTGTRTDGEMATARTTEATMTPEVTGRPGTPSRGICPSRRSTSLKEVTQQGPIH